MKYLLIEVAERDISVPEFFESHEEAHDTMCSHVAAICDVSQEEIKESYYNGEEFDDRTCVTEDTAWTERCGNNFDWKIFKVNDAGQIV